MNIVSVLYAMECTQLLIYLKFSIILGALCKAELTQVNLV